MSEIINFICLIEDFLRSRSAKTLEILVAPLVYNSALTSAQIYSLYSLGFTFSNCDLNYTLKINSENFIDKLSDGNKKRLKKCNKQGFLTKDLDIEYLPEVYTVIASNRNAKGHRVSMSLEALQEMSKEFPQKTHLFGVVNENKSLIAAAVCFRIYGDVMYVFYWGDIPGYSDYSPVVVLANHIYNYCKLNNIAVLDVGTSTENKEPNLGLINFKKNLGFSESLKFRMMKNL
jgi:lipid II:glycine glycyltransferase (peptidoglycan interpeptide bridge formation enzyme)